jgi:hypothetical protein
MSNPANGSIGSMYMLASNVANAAKQALLVCPAVINNADPAALTDGNGSLLSINTQGFLRVVGPAGGLIGVPLQTNNSIGVTTTTAAPGAGAVLATLTPAAGSWDVAVYVYFSVAGTKNNAEFRIGAGVISSLLLPAVANLMPAVVRVFRAVNLNGATTVSLNATAADAAGTYEAELIATRVG